MEENNEKQGPFKRRIRAVLLALLLFFLIAVATFLFYFNWSLKTPVQEKEAAKKLFEVKAGDGTFSIATNLKDYNLIRYDWAFYLETKIKNLDLQPGVYELSADMNMLTIIDAISNGKTKIVKVTIPEGYRTEQIAQKLVENNLVSYADFVTKAKKYEGKLFPDTYYLSPDYGVDKIIDKMLTDYNSRTTGLDVSLKTLIIASIVEREADNETERPIVAGIYENRLRIGMKMEADPTVQYAKDSIAISNLTAGEQEEYKFWRAITNADYQSAISPYNTFLTDELPAGPICNPGLASIEATINYTPTDNLYFIVANGQVYGAKTYAEHKANVAKYLK